MSAEITGSPLTARPLNAPGQSGDYALREFVDNHYILPLILVFTLVALTTWEWFAYARHLPPQPLLFSVLTVLALAALAIYWRLRWRDVMARKLGRDGERAVGQFLDTHVEADATVFHDVTGPKGNIDHVVICSRGIYAIETKTRTKPLKGNAKVVIDENGLTVNGYAPDRDPITQAVACADELRRILKASTGKNFAVRSVVVFPGWYIEEKRASPSTWVLEPKALPAWISHQKPCIAPSDVQLASYHLSRHIRTQPL